MKTNFFLSLSLFAVAMMQPHLFKAQSFVFKQATVATPHIEGWNPEKVADDGSNVLNGVEFYSHKEVCNSKDVTLAKLVNTNIYPAKVSYRLSPESPVVYVRIPGSSSIEGSCSSNDENIAKLVLSLPAATSEAEKQKIAEYILSHIVVSKIQ